MSAFGGLDMEPLPEGFVPLEGFLVAKCLDGEGDVVIVQRATGGAKVWEIIGWLTMALDGERERAQTYFQSEEPDEGS